MLHTGTVSYPPLIVLYTYYIPHTTIHVPSYNCVRVLDCASYPSRIDSTHIWLYICPQTTYVSSYYSTCVLILLYMYVLSYHFLSLWGPEGCEKLFLFPLNLPPRMNEVRIPWNVSLPVASDAQLLIRNILLPDLDFTDSKNSSHKDVHRDWRERRTSSYIPLGTRYTSLHHACDPQPWHRPYNFHNITALPINQTVLRTYLDLSSFLADWFAFHVDHGTVHIGASSVQGSSLPPE